MLILGVFLVMEIFYSILIPVECIHKFCKFCIYDLTSNMPAYEEGFN